MTVRRNTTITKTLQNMLGGTWKYDNHSSWWCDDGKRHVSRVCSGFYNDNDETKWPPQYYLYSDKEPLRITYFLRLPK